MSKSKDRLYSDTRELVESFRFDQSVASVFEDMISRSVPSYQQILTLLPTLVRYNKTQGNFYDLGCSLGAGMLAMAEGVEGPNKQTIIGVDNSAAMLANARPALDSYAANKAINFDLIEADLVEQEINLAAMVLMNFTLQFIATEQRDQVIKNIYDGLLPKGMLVLSEKIKFDDLATNHSLIDIHHQYKADQGYSEMEISQKRDAIENVLIPETLEAHTNRLCQAGFSIVTPWVQNLQFVSILAIK